MTLNPMAILGVSVTTSLGNDIRTAAAAFRAGISRPRPLDYFQEFSEEDEALVSPIGHVASRSGLEAEGLGKMLALAESAFSDLMVGAATTTAAAQARTGFYLALPDYATRRTPPDRANGDDDEPEFSSEFRRQCDNSLLQRLLTISGSEIQPYTHENFFGDQATFFSALQAAAGQLAEGRTDRCVIGSIDSLLDPDTLLWAMESNRLKVDGQPCGFVAGEAAIFLELASPEFARRIGRPVHGLLSLPGVDRDPKSADTEPNGVGLASAIGKALQSRSGAELGLVLGNLNGEVARSKDWGCALNRLIAPFPVFANVRTMYPARSFGETGCAGVALAIGIGTQALQRRYACGSDILVWCSADSNARGAVILSQSESTP